MAALNVLLQVAGIGAAGEQAAASDHDGGESDELG
jgi:hypothetical protein